MKKFTIFITVLFAAGIFSCSFDADVSTQPNTPSSLERHEYLALMHLEESHEITPETLQSQLGNFLANNAASRSADSPASSVTGVQKFTTVIENGFSSVTANKRSVATEQEASEIPFYLFDLENPVEQTSGYAVTCGDMRIPGILAVVENGEFGGEHPFKDVFYTNLAAYILETIELYNGITDEDIAAAVEKHNSISDGNRAFNDPAVLAILKPHDQPLVTSKTKWNIITIIPNITPKG
jgi:hypothetical protein